MKSSKKRDCRPLYNSRIIDTYIRLIKSRYSYINVNELLSYARMKHYQVEDQGHWFTQEQVDLFHERLQRLTGNRNIAREAGRYAASPDAIGVIREYVLGLVGSAKAYELIGKYATKFTKSSIYESRKIASNKCEITVTPNEGVNERPFQCENRTGYFEAISTIFNFKLPKIEHPDCLFRGGRACRYIVSWQESRAVFWKKMRNYAALVLFLTCIGLYFVSPSVTLTAILPVSVLIVLLLSWYAGTLEIQDLNAGINSLRGSSDKLLEQIDLNYNNVLMINEIGQALSRQTDLNTILSNAMKVLEKRLDYDRGMVFLSDTEKTRLIFRTGFGYTEKQSEFLRETSFHLDSPGSRGVFVVSFREQRPFLINDIDELKGILSARSMEFAKRLGTKSFVCCPIIYKKESLGVLAVDNIKTKRPLVQSDINLLMGIAPEIGISIRNAMLIEAEVEQLRSILKVLAASIDARDPLTAGHSEMVTEYAVGTSYELGLPNDYCEMIRIAALLHDYGKIGIKDSVLKKEGRLEVEEYEIIKTHVVKTREILRQMNFRGIYQQVPDVAGSHHEKLDGSGYPEGLKTDEIPLGAKIIAVADFFEAVTSKRHYREAMPLDTAFKLLRESSDTSFEREVIEAFSRYYNREHNIDSAGSLFGRLII